MPSEKKDEKICVSHLLIPSHDPENRMSDKQITDAVGKLQGDLQKKPDMFGVAALQLSTDIATTVQNPNLNNCVNQINTEDPEEKKRQAVKCIQDYSGNLGCPPKNALDKDFVSAAEKISPGGIGHVQTRFGHHIIKRNRL